MDPGPRQPDLRSKAISPERSDIRSKAVSPDRWREVGLLLRRDSESSVASSYHSTPTNASSQIRSTIIEAMNLPLTPYPDSSAASSQLSPLPEIPDTPSSTLGQFGDLAKKNYPSPAELVQKVHRSWRSQSREGHNRANQSHSRSRSARHHSQSRSTSEQRHGREGRVDREALENRERSLSRSTLQASIDARESRERSLSRSSTQQSLRDRESEKERARERERDRETERSQSQSSHRRAASSRELRLLAHERSYDNDRDIAASKVNMYLQSLAAQTPQSMPSPPQSNSSQTPKPPPSTSQTPKPLASHTPIPSASHTPIPSRTHTPIPTASQTPMSAAPQTPQSMASQTPQSAGMPFSSDPDKQELMQENRGLYQRVAALQRTERDLLAENQELVRQLAVFKKHHETRHQQWKDEFSAIKEREKILLVEAQQLKAKIMRQEEQILDLAVANAQVDAPAPELTEKQITSWFAERDETWFSWAQNFASRDANRLSTGLHPLQYYEVCDGVKAFVKLTDDFKLPAELLVKGTDMVQALLHGMLANFICAEALSSPFWIFNAISSGTLESPCVAPPTAISPGGFRLDLAMLNAIPSRTLYAQAPSHSISRPAQPRDPRFPPPLITTNLRPDNIHAASLAYPMKAEMENMFHMLTKAQSNDSNTTPVQLLEAQLVHLFATAGISLKSPQDANGVEAKRMLIESRLNYARRLKERFLSGAARFLLQDQDPAGIANLERTLTDHIDDALRFSCQLWARPGLIRFHGFAALGGQLFRPGNKLMGLCQAQSPSPNLAEGGAGAVPSHVLAQFQLQAGPETPGPPGYYDGRPVVMVCQPAIEGIEVGGGLGRDESDPSKPRKISRVWMKARVLVATSSQPQAANVPATMANSVTNTAAVGGMMTVSTMTVMPETTAEKTLLLGPVPKGVVKQKVQAEAVPVPLPVQVATYYANYAGLGQQVSVMNMHPVSLSVSAPLEKVPVTIMSQATDALRTA